MLEVFRVTLEARNPYLGCMRSYHIEVGSDLLGSWMVEIAYGRIGTSGRCIRHVADGPESAARIIRQVMRRRSTAHRRIGVSYRIIDLHDPYNWAAGIFKSA